MSEELIGKVLADKYKIEKKVGKGGFGSVYRGYDLNLKRPVAIKLLTSFGLDNQFKVRFQRESESLAGLNHPNIVTLYDAGEVDGLPYQVMEFVDGVSLQELVNSATLANAEICSLGVQICDAMVYAHAQGIVHRDLTLKNIMVALDENEKTQVKVLDFGLVKFLNAEMQTTGKAMMGTPSYMSPEQVRGEAVDHRSDLFSFGVGLFRILNGRYPFEAEHPTAVMYMIVNETNLTFNEGVLEDFRDITLRCLEKDPRNRPRSFAEVADEFRAVRAIVEGKVDKETVEFTITAPMEERTSKRNPFLNRVMIKNPADFFGREREVRKIYSRLDAPHPQSISVVGDRRIGKSSLLNYIYNRRIRKRNMQNYENAIFVYLDFQSDVDFTVSRFIGFLFTVFGYETRSGKDYREGKQTLDDLKEVVQELHAAGRRIIVLMDEFESITRNPNFDEGFFSFLRALANNYRVAYVTSSCDELQLMCHNKDIADSPFFNIFSNLPLRPFTPTAARELITVPSQTEGVPLAAHADKIIELAGYFPLYLQIACSCVFENVLEHPNLEPDWPRIVGNFRDEVFPHFEFVWERMDGPERENLGRIAAGEKINRKYEFVNEGLQRRGYLIPTEEGTTLFSEAFRYFVLRQEERRSKPSVISRLFGRK